jgi:pimeloyl-ACP methyl ester carboxylesterase
MAPRYGINACDRPASLPTFPVFSGKYAERLAEALPNARVEWIDDAYTLVPEDRPDRLAESIASFVGAPAASSRPAPAAR